MPPSFAKAAPPPTAPSPFFADLGEPGVSYPVENLEALSYEADPKGTGKDVYNPPRPDGKRSPYYDQLWQGGREHPTGDHPHPESQSWWDFHVYHQPGIDQHVEYAHKLYQAVRREFPELTTYRFWETPLGPHPMPMFEVNVHNPAQLGAVMSWFVANRGPCSVLIHPNTGDDAEDHSTHSTWIGDKVPISLDILKAFVARRDQQKA